MRIGNDKRASTPRSSQPEAVRQLTASRLPRPNPEIGSQLSCQQRFAADRARDEAPPGLGLRHTECWLHRRGSYYRQKGILFHFCGNATGGLSRDHSTAARDPGSNDSDASVNRPVLAGQVLTIFSSAASATNPLQRGVMRHASVGNAERRGPEHRIASRSFTS